MKEIKRRTCAVCRKAAAQDELIRLVCDKSGLLVVQRQVKLEGRGAYLHASPACISKCTNIRIWQNVFKRNDISKDSLLALKDELDGYYK